MENFPTDPVVGVALVTVWPLAVAVMRHPPERLGAVGDGPADGPRPRRQRGGRGDLGFTSRELLGVAATWYPGALKLRS